MMIDNGDRVTRAIRNAIRQEIETIVDEEAKEAATRVQEKVRRRTGAIAATVLERWNMEQCGTQLKIIVDLENAANAPAQRPPATDV